MILLQMFYKIPVKSSTRGLTYEIDDDWNIESISKKESERY